MIVHMADQSMGWVTVLVGCALSVAAWGQDAQELVRKSDRTHRLPVEKVRSTMVLQSEKGDQRTLKFENLMVRDPDGNDKLKLRFMAPADINGTALLNVSRKTGDDEQWLYLPSFHKTRRLGGAELGDRFVGSDLYYEDLKQRPVDDFKYTLLRSEKLPDGDCYVVEGLPASPEVAKESPYGKLQVWLRKDILFPVRVRSFDKNLKPMKEAEFKDVKRVNGEAYQADMTTIVDVQRKHRTIITVEDRQTKIPVADDMFSQHKLVE
jgi:hypothetical protein